MYKQYFPVCVRSSPILCRWKIINLLIKTPSRSFFLFPIYYLLTLKYEYFCPWKSADGENWNYLSMYSNCQAGEFSSIEERERELFSMFEYWKSSTLFSDEFEVFNTPSMGLGVRVIEQDSQSVVFFRPLSLHALHGFWR